jgi:hypothetical protein
MVAAVTAVAASAAGNRGVTARCGGGNLGVSATIHVVA